MEQLVAWLPWLFVAAVGFFALGWLGARIDVKRLLSESRALPASYFRGLNFLLNEQPDKAIDALIEASNQHPEAIELQLALGSLFRRRGDIDRALRVHKDLSERSGLTVEQRTNALFETALDYHKSGLLDYAEKILADIVAANVATDDQRARVLQLLLNLYQQERNWQRAVDTARMLDADRPSTQRKYTTEIANFYCEMAIVARTLGSIEAHAEAYAFLDRALQESAGCVRANLLFAEWLVKDAQFSEAIVRWEAVEKQDPTYMGLIADQILNAYRRTNQIESGFAELVRLQKNYPALDILNALFYATLESHGPQAAFTLVKDDLHHNPTLVGLDRLLEAKTLAASAEEKPDLEMVGALVHSHATRLAVYLCKSCGFKAKQFYWHCPACGGWDTFPPRRTAEYDTAERHLAQLQAEHIENRKVAA